MGRRYIVEHRYVTVIHKPYDGVDLIRDIILTFFTGGLWLLWILIRELRR